MSIHRYLLASIFVASTVLTSATAFDAFGASKSAPPPEMDAWLKSAKLGPYDKGTEDWKAIVKRAEKEGQVVVYSSSSRVAKVAKSFMDRFPKIKVKSFDLGSIQSIEKTIREQQAGLFNADIVTTAGAEVIHEMLNKNRIVNYVPHHFKNQIPKENREPLLVRINEAVAVLYNGQAHPNAAPIKNIWELTQAKWKGKVGIKNPLSSGSIFMGVATLVQHADEMAAAYKRLHGKSLKLSPGVKDAGHEFVARLLKNDVVIFKSGSKLAGAAGKKNQKNPLLAITNMTHLSYNDRKGYINKVLVDVDPVSKIIYPTYTAIARQAPHPNAAKVFTAYFLGSTKLNANSSLKKPYDKGKSLDLLLGLAPYFDPGSVSPRSNVPLPAGGEVWSEMKAWTADPDYLAKNAPKIRDFWTMQSSK